MVRFGIIGLGKIASKFAEDLQQVAGVELTAVGSRDLHKAQLFAQQFNARTSYASYDDVLQDPDVDVVYIATPHHLHYANTKSCLLAGKSVICEKPFAMNLNEVKEMIALAQRQQLFLMEALWTRFIPATIKVKELIDSGIIGDVKFLEANFGFSVPKETPGRLTDPKMGGGTLLDIGIYNLFISLFLLGKPDSISATGQLYNHTDRQCSITLSYKNSMAVLMSSFECYLPTEATIYGSHGSIKMHPAFHQCTKVTVVKNDFTEEVLEIPVLGHGYVHEIEEVRDCLNRNLVESTKMNWQSSIELMETMDEVRKQIGLTYDA